MTGSMRNDVTRALLTLAAGLAATVPLLAATEAPAPVAIEQFQELDEVIVHGTNLRDRIVKAEDRFYKLYNELNKDSEYDINCAYLPLEPDTQIADRFCAPGFFADAIVEQMQWSERCKGSQDSEGNYVPPPPCYTPPPPDLVLMERSSKLAANVMKVIRSDPRLGDMAGELDDLHMERTRLARRYQELKTADGEQRAAEPRYRPVIRR